MPTKRVPCWKDKQVLVSVYVEMPKKGPASITHHHHRHHYVNHTIKREAISHMDGAAGGKGYVSSRRAELLQYSQYLRQSAREASESSSSSSSMTYVPNPNHSRSHPKPQAQMVTFPKKPKNSKVPTCFSNCKIPTMFGPLLTSFQAKKESKARKKGGGNVSNRIKAAVKRLKVQKQHAFLCNLFSSSARKKRN